MLEQEVKVRVTGDSSDSVEAIKKLGTAFKEEEEQAKQAGQTSGEAFNALPEIMSRLSDSINDLVSSLTRVKDKSKETGTEGERAGRDQERGAQKAKQGWDRLESSLERIHGRLSGLTGLGGSLGTILGGVGVGLGVKSIWDMNASLEQLTISMKTVSGSNKEAEANMQWLKKFAADTPYEIQDLGQQFVKMKAFGMDATKFLPMLGNTASALGKPLSMAVDMFTDATTGEFERLKEFGVKATQSGKEVTFHWQQNGKDMAMTTSKSAADITGALNTIFAKYKGGLEAQSKSGIGLASTLSDNVRFFLIEATGKVFDRFKGQISNLLTVMDKASKDGSLDKWANQISDSLQSAFNMIVSVFNFVKDNWQLISGILTSMVAMFIALKAVSAAISFANLIKDAIALYKAFQELQIISKIMAGIQLAISGINLGAIFAAMTSPIGIAVIAITAFAAAAYLIYKNWGTIKPWLENLWKEICDLCSQGVDFVVDVFVSGGSLIMGVIAGPIAGIVTYIAQHWEEVKEATTQAWQGVVNAVQQGVGWVKEKASQLGQLGKEAYTWGSQLLQGFVNGVKSGVDWVANGVKEVCSRAVQAGKEILGIKSPSKVFHQIGEDTSKGLENGVTNRLKEIQQKAEELGYRIIKGGSTGANKAEKEENEHHKKQKKVDPKKEQEKKEREEHKTQDKQMDKFEEQLTKLKDTEQYKYNDMSLEEERKFWEKKLTHVKKGSENEKEIKHKIYELDKAQAKKTADDKIELLKYEMSQTEGDLEKKRAKAVELQKFIEKTYGKQSEKYRDISREIVEIDKDRVEQQKELVSAIEEAQIEHAETMKELELDRINYEIEMGRMKSDQAIRLEQQEADKVYQIRRQSLLRQMQDDKLTVVEKRELTNKLADLDDKYNAAVIKNSRKLRLEQTKDMRAIITDLNSTISKGIADMIKGTLSFKDAIKGLGKYMLDTFIDTQAKRLANWMTNLAQERLLHKTTKTEEAATEKAAEVAKTATATAEEQTRQLLAKQGAMAAQATGAASATAIVGMNAAVIEATLGMLTAMAQAISTIVPAGPGIAAAMFGGITAAQGALTASTAAATGAIASMSVPSAAGGWKVPNDTMAMVHEDEMILPAHLTRGIEGLIKGGGGGAPHFNINITSPDAKGVKRLFDKNAKQMVKTLHNEYRNFNKLSRG